MSCTCALQFLESWNAWDWWNLDKFMRNWFHSAAQTARKPLLAQMICFLIDLRDYICEMSKLRYSNLITFWIWTKMHLLAQIICFLFDLFVYFCEMSKLRYPNLIKFLMNFTEMLIFSGARVEKLYTICKVNFSNTNPLKSIN